MNRSPFQWKDEGFALQPSLLLASGTERIYRAWGNRSSKMGNSTRPGVCFSLMKAHSRVAAEQLYSVMEYGNPVRFITAFSIAKGTPLWRGPICGGDLRAALEGSAGEQVFIERAYIPFVFEGVTQSLHDDLGKNDVFVGPVPRIAS